MAIRKPTRRLKKTNKRNNPAWLDKLFGKSTTRRDSLTITVLDGTISIGGKGFKEIGSDLYDILENELKKVKIEFHPLGSNKTYILNRPVDKDNILENEPKANRRVDVLARRKERDRQMND